MLSSSAVVLSVLLAVGAKATACVDFFAPITASANNVNLATNGTLPVQGTFNISFHYCPPTAVVPKRHSTVQILGHGATYTKTYWDWPQSPAKYSYVRRALAEGYHVLTYDRLGSGASARPDPNNTVQIPLDAAIGVQIAQSVRAGTLVPQVGGFSKIAYVGHSLGSITLNSMIIDAPSAVDAAVFTGYSHVLNTAAVLQEGEIEPAALAIPSRFGGLDDGYVVALNRSVFYGPTGTFDPAVLNFDNATQNTVSTGEVATIDNPQQAAPNFAGHVLEISGANDVIFCTATGCPNLSGDGSFFPQAASFSSVVTPNTGHDLNLQNSAPTSYSSILQWLDSHGF